MGQCKGKPRRRPGRDLLASRRSSSAGAPHDEVRRRLLESQPAVPGRGDTLGAEVSDLEGSVFLVTGVPAAGKSTVADRLARLRPVSARPR